MLLGDRTTEGGFTNDWKRVEETMIFVAKQEHAKTKRLGGRMELASRIDVQVATIILSPSSPSTFSMGRTLGEETLED